MGIPLPNTAMVMAAGKGTRMRPLTNDKPKPLVTVSGTTLLDHVLDHLRDAGVGKLVINAHYFAEQIEAHVAAHAADFQLTVSDERAELLDTGGGLVQAKPMIDADPFFCINADNWWTDLGENAFQRLANAWDDATMDVLMLVIPTRDARNTQGRGDFNLDDAGRLSRRAADADAAYVWTGIQLIAKRLIVDPPASVFSTNVFWDRAIAAGRCFGEVHHGLWFDVGYPEAIGMTEAVIGG
jgi:N-acetyl-alpha-D-muramate 1-phosphate uridylyltransferase